MSGRRGPEDRDDDPRSDIQQVVESRKDDAERAQGGDETSPLEDAGAEDGVGGTAGVVKNQDVAPGSPTGDG
ncbi:hypothetical protein D1610_13045 [Sphingomonas gilva]|uniref:Uncharacterized protein n=1 Tax=Sphingomonas gilva TaxID=2305907 RepID=A0A396RL36_9SPHN|nr:hypothetical protein [Sphingomonas gilva]RHW17044.1 hypothetical protein D1610_13045 [Sphingomonas gilva]